MGRQSGTVRLDGKTGGLIFYKTKYGNLVRSSWTLSKERLANDPKLKGRREINKEFGYSSRVGKLMREALGRCCRFAEEGSTHHRLASAIVKAVKQDKTNGPGLRQLTSDNVELLKGFRWRADAGLSGVLLKDYSIQLDVANGQVSLSINGLMPVEHLRLPGSATHLQLTLVIARVDHERDSQTEAFERSVMIDGDSSVPLDISLSAALPAGGGNVIVAGIGYQVQQEVNGQMAGLVEGSGFEIRAAGVV